MGELYCCSNDHKNTYDESNNKLISKNDFTKKYIIGKGGFSKVSFIIIVILLLNFRYGKCNISKIIKFSQ